MNQTWGVGPRDLSPRAPGLSSSRGVGGGFGTLFRIAVRGGRVPPVDRLSWDSETSSRRRNPPRLAFFSGQRCSPDWRAPTPEGDVGARQSGLQRCPEKKASLGGFRRLEEVSESHERRSTGRTLPPRMTVRKRVPNPPPSPRDDDRLGARGLKSHGPTPHVWFMHRLSRPLMRSRPHFACRPPLVGFRDLFEASETPKTRLFLRTTL